MNLPKRPEGAGEYDHARHAGNAADVFKHAAMIALVDELQPKSVLESHAGRGRYHLGPQGEWRAGIGALLERDNTSAPRSVHRYLELLDARPSKRGVRYLGSPTLLRKSLPSAALSCCELDDDAADELRAAVPDAAVQTVDGLAALRETRAEFVLVDPPYASKSEWSHVANAVKNFASSAKGTLLLWYPVKTLTRPNALIAQLADADGFVVETSPHLSQLSRGRLVGSGLVVVRPPPGAFASLCELASYLTPALGGETWSLRARSLRSSTSSD